MLRWPLCCHILRQAPTTLKVSCLLPTVACPRRNTDCLIQIRNTPNLEWWMALVAPFVVYEFPRLLKPSPPHMVARLQQIPHMALYVLLSHFGPSSPNGLTTWCPCLVILCILSCVLGPRYANIARRWSRHPWFLALVSANRYSYLHGVGRVDAITITCGDG